MSYLRPFLPGSGFSTTIGFAVSLVSYCLYWYLNTSYVVALVLIALPSILAWLYTSVLIVLKYTKGLHLVDSPTLASFPHRSESEFPTNLLYLARWFAYLSVLHASCWWLLLILMLFNWRHESSLPIYGDSPETGPENVDFLCPSTRCSAFFAAMGGTITAACISTIQLLCLVVLLISLRTSPWRITGTSEIGDLLNHNMDTLLSMRERTRMHWGNSAVIGAGGGASEGGLPSTTSTSSTSTWKVPHPRAWIEARSRRKHHHRMASTSSEASFGHSAESKHNVLLRSLPARISAHDESRRRARAYSAAPDSSGRLQRSLSSSDSDALSSCGENHHVREDPEIKRRDFYYDSISSAGVHSPAPIRHPSLTDTSILKTFGTPSAYAVSPTSSENSDKAEIGHEESPPTGDTPRAMLGDRRSHSASSSTPRASRTQSGVGWIDASFDLDTPRQPPRSLRLVEPRRSLVLDREDEVDGLDLDFVGFPEGHHHYTPPDA